jgi:hypothetical protein
VDINLIDGITCCFKSVDIAPGKIKYRTCCGILFWQTVAVRLEALLVFNKENLQSAKKIRNAGTFKS